MTIMTPVVVAVPAISLSAVEMPAAVKIAIRFQGSVQIPASVMTPVITLSMAFVTLPEAPTVAVTAKMALTMTAVVAS
jgi:hypothetical protein